MEDNFLPIDGARMGDYLQRLLPHLDGRWTSQQLYDAAPEQHRENIGKLIRALQDARMLYETADDLPDPQHSPSPYVTRVEARSSTPIRLISHAMRSRLLVLGAPEMAVAVAEAAIEMNLQPPVIVSSEWNDYFEKQLKTALKKGGDNNGHRASRLEFDSGFAWSAVHEPFDTVVIVHNGGQDWERIDAALSELPENVSVLPLLACGAYIVAGPVAAAQSALCLHCLSDRYRGRTVSQAALSPPPIAVGVRIAGRILLQRWIDWKTSVLPPREELLFSELNLDNLEISQGAFLLNLDCPHSRRLVLDEVDEASGCQHVSFLPVVENWQDAFWASAHKFLIHSVTGPLAHVQEGDLIQLPYNQSSAEWYLPGQDRKVWSTETADNVRDARVAVIQRSLEQILNQSNGLLHSSRNGTAPDLYARLITSGIPDERFAPEAFFRALGLLADEMNAWSKVTIGLNELKEHAMPLIGYLEDISALAHVQVHRHTIFSSAGCEVLKFMFRDKPVSVVAGPQGASVWVQGFKDIWLEITARADLPCLCEIVPKTRYRCSEASTELLLTAMHDICTRLSLSFGLTALSGHDIGFTEPVVFASASILCPAKSRTEYLEPFTIEDQGYWSKV